jgi:hypothetical protein
MHHSLFVRYLHVALTGAGLLSTRIPLTRQSSADGHDVLQPRPPPPHEVQAGAATQSRWADQHFLRRQEMMQRADTVSFLPRDAVEIGHAGHPNTGFVGLARLRRRRYGAAWRSCKQLPSLRPYWHRGGRVVASPAALRHHVPQRPGQADLHPCCGRRRRAPGSRSAV